MFTSADIGYDKVTDPAAKSTADGAWIYVRGADFGYGASEFIAEVKGKGRIEVRLDDISLRKTEFAQIFVRGVMLFRVIVQPERPRRH